MTNRAAFVGATTQHCSLATSKLDVQSVSKWFRTSRANVHALAEVSMQVAAGQIVCVVGPSGCGKSTLLDIIAGLTQPDAGQVFADGQEVAGPGRERLVVFQEPSLFPWLNVFGNVMFGLRLCPELRGDERRDIAHHYLSLVGLEKFEKAHVHELSGGMKQRVALARALAPDPQVLLMDEPFGALDAMTREHLYDDVQKIWADSRKTVVFVTHNMREATCLGDRILLMSSAPGTIARSFDIPLSRPRSIYNAELVAHAAAVADALRGTMGGGVPE
ncbi:ABC transporter ATP-binding protein [Ensifer adhaerens]|uniref:ABC transporter ATP-binding protein n=1 Tax=Ensifer adhaerens TaxID=106592 RepID=UPI000CF02135|nr:ABC transporter ATP-binding protein [Ensifer adhaerens]